MLPLGARIVRLEYQELWQFQIKEKHGTLLTTPRVDQEYGEIEQTFYNQSYGTSRFWNPEQRGGKKFAKV